MNLAEKRRSERQARLKNAKQARKGREWKPQVPYMQTEEIAACTALMTNAEVFEYGAGGSTIFYGAKAKAYYSLETNPTYYETVKASLTPELDHVKIYYEPNPQKYLQKISEFGQKFDVVLVDNDKVPRLDCALKAFDYLKDDGILLVHDALEGLEQSLGPDGRLYVNFNERRADFLASNSDEDQLKKEFQPLLKKYALHELVVSLSVFKKILEIEKI